MLRTCCALAFVLCAAPRLAAAYDLTTSSTGMPVHWVAGPVTFTAALSPGPAGLDPTAAHQALANAVATWRAVLGDHGIDIKLAEDGSTAAHTNDGINTVRFAVVKGDRDLERGLLARTFVAYSTKDGTLQDTDVVLDGVDYTWTTDPAHCTDEYDLESAMTHELGHAVGLAHAIGHPEATMYATGDACEVEKRDLAADDIAGATELYTITAGDDGGCAATNDASFALPLLAVFMIVIRRSWRSRDVLRQLALVAMAALVVLPSAAQAATLRRLAIAELADHAVMIVRGKVTASTVRPELETDSTLAVTECLAGTCPAELVVRRHGGERDGRGLWVDGEAQLSVGDEVVVFVRIDADHHARVLGGIQGTWRIERTATTARAVRDLRGQRIFADATSQAGEREVTDLAALTASIRATR